VSWGEADIPDLSRRVAVVTGASSGIGFETARALAAKGARVILACRSRKSGPQAVARIREAVPGADVLFDTLDLASLQSIAMFAKEITTEVDRLDLLINNAGVMMPPLGYTKENFELQFGVNHLGHFALTAHLFPLLEATRGARVVTVSSLAHLAGRIHFTDLQSMKSYQAMLAYGQSKLANLLFMRELARRCEGANVDVISAAAHPGSTRTELQRHSELMRSAVRFFAQDAPAGALPTLYAATAAGVRSGDYYGPMFGMVGPPARALMSPLARDPVVARRLWDVSEDLTGVAFPTIEPTDLED
jgi:NAD(P)-dependent dehydrogenase (short-subunit alcohol dehydrogenase family)